MTATNSAPLSSHRFRGKEITVYVSDLAIVVEARITDSGGEATDRPWHRWEPRAPGPAGLTGFVRVADEGAYWLWGWGPDRRAALLLARSAP